MTNPAPDARPAAEELFAGFLEEIEAGAAPDFAALCAAHPGAADELRRMHVRWSAISQAFTALSQAAPGAPVAAVSARVEDLLARLRAVPGRAARYAIGPEIARGAMGRVVSAWDEELRREVALKVHADATGDTRLQRRFLEEAQITGQLDHPGIVPIHELGLDDSGRPFFAMRLVRGEDLGAVLERSRAGDPAWTRTRVLHVLLRVCEAMAYAHSKGVVHRDLKPGNIMVGPFGEVYVMDWGLARVVGDAAPGEWAPDGIESLRGSIAADDGASPLLTQHGDVVGTPAYMAPEVAAGGTLAAPAMDVYSVGAILYHLCAGAMPYAVAGEKLSAADVLARVRAGPPAPLPADVPAELRAIHDRAMARDPGARYAGMAELADDLRAYLELRVVRAYSTGRWAELRKWIARNRALSTAMATAFLALAAGVVVSTRLWMEADRTAARLVTELDRSEFNNARLSLDREDAESAEDLLWRQHFAGRMPRATAWALVGLHARSPCLATVPAPTRGESPVAFARPSGEAAVGGDDGRVHVLGGEDLAPRRTLGEPGSALLAVAVDAAGRVAFAGARDGSLALLDFESGAVLRRVAAHQSDLRALALSPAAVAFATGGGDGRVLWWPDAQASPTELVNHGHSPVWSLAFDAAGARLASGAEDGSVRVVDLVSRAVTALQLGNQEVMALSFARAANELWVGSATHNIYVVQLDPVQRLRTLPTRNGSCRDLAHEPDGTVLAGGWWRLDRLAPDGSARATIALRGLWQFDVDAQRQRLVASSRAAGISLIDRSDRGRRPLPGHRMAMSGDGRRVAVGAAGKVVVRDVDGATEPAEPVAPATGWLALDRTGARLAVLPAGQEAVAVYDVATRRRLFEVEGPVDPPFGESFAFSPDGAELAVVAGRTIVRRIDAATGALRAEHQTGSQQVLRLRYSGDGSTLAVIVRRSNDVRLLDLAAGSFRDVPVGRLSSAVALSHDARTVVSGGWQGAVTLIDVRTLARREIRPHAGTTFGLAFAPWDPGMLIVSGGAGGVTFWDLDAGVACHNLLRDEAPVHELAIAADGRTLAARTTSGVVLLDLEYHERHVAGNLEHHLAGLAEQMAVPPARAAELRSWAAAVLARPWPRWPAR